MLKIRNFQTYPGGMLLTIFLLVVSFFLFYWGSQKVLPYTMHVQEYFFFGSLATQKDIELFAQLFTIPLILVIVWCSAIVLVAGLASTYSDEIKIRIVLNPHLSPLILLFSYIILGNSVNHFINMLHYYYVADPEILLHPVILFSFSLFFFVMICVFYSIIIFVYVVFTDISIQKFMIAGFFFYVFVGHFEFIERVRIILFDYFLQHFFTFDATYELRRVFLDAISENIFNFDNNLENFFAKYEDYNSNTSDINNDSNTSGIINNDSKSSDNEKQ